MNRYFGVLVTSLIAGSAFAGSPPHWAKNQAKDNQRTQAQQADSRDVNQASRAGDWKRSAPVQRESPPRIAANSNQPPAPGQTRPPVTRQPPPAVTTDNSRGRTSNGDRGDRRGFDDPRRNSNWNPEQHEQSLRNWSNDRHDNRDSRTQASWRDTRGHIWHQDQSWYSRYRIDHFRYVQGRYFARERFRIGFYQRPYGFTSRLWLRGNFLPFAYYSAGYTLGNYWSYDLYDPPFGCRWVRVGDDALLVDNFTGEVVDGVYNIFW
jgi:Ni/Co efflux regulator RcnB